MKKLMGILGVCLALTILALLLGCGLMTSITSEQLVLQHGPIEYKMEMPGGIPLIGDLGFKVIPYKYPVCRLVHDREKLHCVIIVSCLKPEILGMRLEWSIEDISFVRFWIYENGKFKATKDKTKTGFRLFFKGTSSSR